MKQINKGDPRLHKFLPQSPQSKEVRKINQGQLSLLFNYMHKRVFKVLRVFHLGDQIRASIRESQALFKKTKVIRLLLTAANFNF